MRIPTILAAACLILVSCQQEEGCTDQGALNFDSEAVIDDGSCDYLGCTDPTAQNFEPNATVDNGDCIYPPTFSCSDGTTSVDFDGHSYMVVQIGNDCWFAENLRTTRFRNGDQITEATQEEWTEPNHTNPHLRLWGYGDIDFVPCQIEPLLGLSGFWWDPCNDSEGVLDRYGLHYNGWAVIDDRNLCPSGWHVPSDAEFEALRNHATELGYEDNPGLALKLLGDPFFSSPSPIELTWELPRTGFRGGMIGLIDPDGGSYGSSGHWWSSTTAGLQENASWTLRRSDDSFESTERPFTQGLSARCVQD